MKTSNILAAVILLTLMPSVYAKPLKVFILVGQSNMEGYADIRTFEGIKDDPATQPLYRQMVDSNGKPVVCEHAWLSYLTSGPDGTNVELTGKMTAGYGTMAGQDQTKPGGFIGPEFTFALHMDKALNEPFLIIKTAWGGKSLLNSFRPPSAGPVVFHDYIATRIRERGGEESLEQAKKSDNASAGIYYGLMIEHVIKVLGDIKRVVPDYDPKQGYEISGFVWFQAWNDWCDGWWYPAEFGEKRFDEYGRLLELFIRDVRKDLKAPKMPFVIGVAGFDGLKAPGDMLLFRKAMAAPSLVPEFKGNVIAVQTAPFWDHKLTEIEGKLEVPENKAYWDRNASNQAFHYYGSAKTFGQIGKAFAEALIPLKKDSK